ncbi:MAG: hypothetical protein V1784_09450 [bacterium]
MKTEKSKMTVEAALEVLSDADYTISDLLGLARQERDGRECMARHISGDGELADDEAEALASLDIDLQTCDCTGCSCVLPAVTTDAGGVPVCRACSSFFCAADGDVVCGQIFRGTRCHVCGGEIEWSGICTGTSGRGTPNHRYGSCVCGARVWLDEDRGGWGHYSYDFAGPPT